MMKGKDGKAMPRAERPSPQMEKPCPGKGGKAIPRGRMEKPCPGKGGKAIPRKMMKGKDGKAMPRAIPRAMPRKGRKGHPKSLETQKIDRLNPKT